MDTPLYGVGTDLVEVARIERAYKRWGERFVDHLLMDAEREEFERSKRKVRYLAMRFSAKEALVKALGTGFRQGMWLRDVGCCQAGSGKPYPIFSDKAEALREERGAGQAEISLTDEAGLIVAFAVMMRRTETFG
ncbi:holo-[acyl-carrier protein] synthase [Natronospira proteinivora]|uniref:Holo-[acyl-carrier-protein] synthase n=1 Tax=Natronospira proteinivora TaxID=1807133 RepID=A0ABT1G5U9_9GAMM|nr:holo-ACP synthase [Natronospira proteinivora]MCP1726681.1 holo-[acyl-carrier protein] synthase [Natronospira proteinivora]